jgi:hypothetical protein
MAMGTLERTEIDLAKQAASQTLPLMAKIPNPHSKLYAYLATPKGGEQTNPLRLLWLGGHPSVGGGTAPQGRLTEDDRLWFVCV